MQVKSLPIHGRSLCTYQHLIPRLAHILSWLCPPPLYTNMINPPLSMLPFTAGTLSHLLQSTETPLSLPSNPAALLCQLVLSVFQDFPVHKPSWDYAVVQLLQVVEYPPQEVPWLHKTSLRSLAHDPMCNAYWYSTERSHGSESETFRENLCVTMVRMLLADLRPNTMTPTRFLHCKKHIQLCFLQGRSVTEKEVNILRFPTNLMRGPLTCTHPSQQQKPEGSSLLHQHGIQCDTSWSALRRTDSSLWHCTSSCLRHIENAMWDCHSRQIHHLEHNYIWIWFVQLRTLHVTEEKKRDLSHLWYANSTSLAMM